MRILVAVPTFETVMPETFKSIWDLDRAGHDVDFMCVKGYDCAKARNQIAKNSMAGKKAQKMAVWNCSRTEPTISRSSGITENCRRMNRDYPSRVVVLGVHSSVHSYFSTCRFHGSSM